MSCYFFGVRTAGIAGHYLYGPDGPVSLRTLQGIPLDYRETFPSSYESDQTGPLQPQGMARLTYHLGPGGVWTVLSIWDRTGDDRFNSHSDFILQGHHDLDGVLEEARKTFPSVLDRIGPIWQRQQHEV